MQVKYFSANNGFSENTRDFFGLFERNIEFFEKMSLPICGKFVKK